MTSPLPPADSPTPEGRAHCCWCAHPEQVCQHDDSDGTESGCCPHCWSVGGCTNARHGTCDSCDDVTELSPLGCCARCEADIAAEGGR